MCDVTDRTFDAETEFGVILLILILYITFCFDKITSALCFWRLRKIVKCPFPTFNPV